MTKRYWYETQERAFAPGIADGWPAVIKAPHTKHGRLVRRESPEPRSACAWREDADGNWQTACDQLHILIEGTPSDNRMRFCCYCGGAIGKESAA